MFTLPTISILSVLSILASVFLVHFIIKIFVEYKNPGLRRRGYTQILSLLGHLIRGSSLIVSLLSLLSIGIGSGSEAICYWILKFNAIFYVICKFWFYLFLLFRGKTVHLNRSSESFSVKLDHILKWFTLICVPIFIIIVGYLSYGEIREDPLSEYQCSFVIPYDFSIIMILLDTSLSISFVISFMIALRDADKSLNVFQKSRHSIISTASKQLPQTPVVPSRKRELQIVNDCFDDNEFKDRLEKALLQNRDCDSVSMAHLPIMASNIHSSSSNSSRDSDAPKKLFRIPKQRDNSFDINSHQQTGTSTSNTSPKSDTTSEGSTAIILQSPISLTPNRDGSSSIEALMVTNSPPTTPQERFARNLSILIPQSNPELPQLIESDKDLSCKDKKEAAPSRGSISLTIPSSDPNITPPAGPFVKRASFNESATPNRTTTVISKSTIFVNAASNGVYKKLMRSHILYTSISVFASATSMAFLTVSEYNSTVLLFIILFGNIDLGINILLIYLMTKNKQIKQNSRLGNIGTTILTPQISTII